MDLTKKIDKLTLTRRVGLSPEKGSKDSKTVTIRVKFDGSTIGDVFNSAMSAIAIKWQTRMRKKYESVKSGAVYDIAFIGPRGRGDAVEEISDMLAGMDEAAREKWIADNLLKKAKKQSPKPATNNQPAPAAPPAPATN